jgi:glutamate/aspartate transport system permease protein
MFDNLDFDVIRRSLGYLFLDGMTFTLMLTGLAALGSSGSTFWCPISASG